MSISELDNLIFKSWQHNQFLISPLDQAKQSKYKGYNHKYNNPVRKQLSETWFLWIIQMHNVLGCEFAVLVVKNLMME
jgi:hypothetical protein